MQCQPMHLGDLRRGRAELRRGMGPAGAPELLLEAGGIWPLEDDLPVTAGLTDNEL